MSNNPATPPVGRATLRDKIAMAAMHRYIVAGLTPAEVAERSYRTADTILAAREMTDEPPVTAP